MKGLEYRVAYILFGRAMAHLLILILERPFRSSTHFCFLPSRVIREKSAVSLLVLVWPGLIEADCRRDHLYPRPTYICFLRSAMQAIVPCLISL